MSKQKLGLALYAGGNHIFYNAGVLKYFCEKGMKYDKVVTYSAGGAIIPFLINKDFDSAVSIFKKITDHNRKNIYLKNLFNDKDVFPHDKIYYQAVKTAVDQCKDNLKKTDKEIILILATFRSFKILTPIVGIVMFIFLIFYSLSVKLTGSFFIRLFKLLFSVKAQTLDLRNLKYSDDIVNVIMGSSTIYPFIKIRAFENSFMLDGKMSMLSPIGELSDCTHVISIHAHDTFMVNHPNFIQLLPIKKVTANPLDYVGSESYVNAFNQGYEEAKTHYERVKKTPFFNVPYIL